MSSCLALSRLARPIIVSTTIAGSCDKKKKKNSHARIKGTYIKSLTTIHLAANILPSTAQLEDRQTPSQHSNKK